MGNNALGPWTRGDSSRSGHRSKGGEEVVSDLGAWVELLCGLPVERPHPHPQPWEHHQGPDGIKLLLLAFNQRLVVRKRGGRVLGARLL